MNTISVRFIIHYFIPFHSLLNSPTSFLNFATSSVSVPGKSNAIPTIATPQITPNKNASTEEIKIACLFSRFIRWNRLSRFVVQDQPDRGKTGARSFRPSPVVSGNAGWGISEDDGTPKLLFATILFQRNGIDFSPACTFRFVQSTSPFMTHGQGVPSSSNLPRKPCADRLRFPTP